MVFTVYGIFMIFYGIISMAYGITVVLNHLSPPTALCPGGSSDRAHRQLVLPVGDSVLGD